MFRNNAENAVVLTVATIYRVVTCPCSEHVQVQLYIHDRNFLCNVKNISAPWQVSDGRNTICRTKKVQHS